MFRRLHNTARVFRNGVSKEVEAIENDKGKDISFGDVAHLVNGARGRQAEKDQDADGGIWSAGQVVGLIDSIPSCQELMDQMITEAEETIYKRLNNLIKPRSAFTPKSKL
jgi:NAD(P)H-dependent flavin oxidoreductase YrpB (nitropropane dioxygenase family)